MEGIKELKEVVEFVAVFASAMDKATKDGLGVEDIAVIVPSLMLAPEAFAGVDKAKLEYEDLDEAEKSELVQLFADKLDLEDDKLEILVEKALNVAIQLNDIVKEVQAMQKA